MKSSLFSVLFLIYSAMGMAQIACPTSLNGSLHNDEFPGCNTCTGAFFGTTAGYTKDNIAFDFPCGEIENSQWFNFTADDSGIVEITIDSIIGRNGVEIGLFDEDLNLLGNCSSGDGISTFPTILFEDVEAWQTYYIMVDGIDGAICKFWGNVIGVHNTRPNFIEFIRQTPTADICVADEIVFEFDPVPFANNYRWQLPSNFEVLDGGSEQDTFVRVIAKEPEVGNFKIIPYNECGDGFTATRFYEIFSRKFRSIGDFNYCIEDENNLPADSCVVIENGCDSCFNYTYHLIEPSPITEITKFICSEDCFAIADTCFQGEGEHFAFFDDYYADGCDSIVRVVLETQTVFPSPNIWHIDKIDGILIDWEEAPFADRYVVFVNRDSFFASPYTEIFLTNPPPTPELNIKVQPKGNCTYLPAELTIINIFTSTDNLLSESAIIISPNPTTGRVNIETNLKIEETEIYDATGRFLQKEKMTSFDLKNQEAGVYFLKIKTNEGVGVKRIFLN